MLECIERSYCSFILLFNLDEGAVSKKKATIFPSNIIPQSKSLNYSKDGYKKEAICLSTINN